MVSRLTVFLALCCLAAPAVYGQQDLQSRVVLDEGLWVTFYDLPSRRFRAIRTAILVQDLQAAARDLSIAANYISIEAERSSDVLRTPLNDVVDRMRSIEQDVRSVTLADLDALFGRAHWLLAQHFLGLGRDARNARNSRNMSLYLWATTHHIERAILWSDVSITREVHSTLEELQKIAGDLQNPQTEARAYREKPIVQAENLLKKIGKQIDRRVLLPMSD